MSKRAMLAPSRTMGLISVRGPGWNILASATARRANERLHFRRTHRLRSYSSATAPLQMPFTGLLGSTKPKVEKILEYEFRDNSLLYEALIAYPLDTHGRNFSDGNKRLAMLGDCALKLVVARGCYAKGLSKGTLPLPLHHE